MTTSLPRGLRVLAPLVAAVSTAALSLGWLGTPSYAASPATSGTASAPHPGRLLAAPAPTACDAPPAPGHVRCLSEVAPIDPPAAVSTPGTPAPGLSPDSTALPEGSSTTTVSSGPWTPGQLTSMYALPASSTTATVGIVDVGHNPHVAADLAAFRSHFGLGACTKANGCLTEMSQTGSTTALPAEHSDWDMEIDLDVEAVSSICRTCRILLVDANSARTLDLLQGAKTAAAKGARYVSMSFGGSEWSEQSSLTSQYLASSTTTFVAATGDDGFGVQYPASASSVIAAGGTTVKRTTTGTSSHWTHTAWNGAGSGCSAFTGRPTAQSANGILAAACARKATADISALADPATGLMIYARGGWYAGGGTSLASPLIAAMYAMAGNHTDPRSIYADAAAHPSDFTDVTSGSTLNCSGGVLCSAHAGWDGPTGLGSPHGLRALTPGAAAATLTLGSPASGVASATVDSPVDWDTSVTGSTSGHVTYTASGLPAGLSLTSTGHVVGTPTDPASGTATVRARITDVYGVQAAGSVTFPWNVTASTGSALSLHAVAPQALTVGDPVALDTSASGAPAGTVYSATGLPAGTSIDRVTGLISGTVSKAGSGTATVVARAVDATGVTVASGHTRFTWAVTAPAVHGLTLASPGARSVRIGHAVSWGVAASAPPAGALSYSATGLPAGTRVTSAGLITGTPTRTGSGTAHVTGTVLDAFGYPVARGTVSVPWVVTQHQFVRTGTLAVTGTPAVGRTLTAALGTLHRDTRSGLVVHPTVRYQWFADGKAISGATGATYRVASRYLHQRISFRATVSAATYRTASFTSPASAAVR